MERGPPPLTASHSLCPDASTPHATAASPTSAKKGKQDDISHLTCLLSLLHHLLGSEKTVFPYILVRSTLPLPETMTRPAKPFYWHTRRTDEKIQIICSNDVEHKNVEHSCCTILFFRCKKLNATFLFAPSAGTVSCLFKDLLPSSLHQEP